MDKEVEMPVRFASNTSAFDTREHVADGQAGVSRVWSEKKITIFDKVICILNHSMNGKVIQTD